jgi:hypothetical protein
MKIRNGIISHGDVILRDYRRKTAANYFRYMSSEAKFAFRVCMWLAYATGIGFAVGFFAGVFVS